MAFVEVSHLVKRFERGRSLFRHGTTVKAVDDVSFYIDEGELLGLVGESGSGKSITALSILRLISSPGRIAGGSIKFKDEELTTATLDRMREIRGNDIAMIFQDPMTSLNPVYTVGEQIAEALRVHQRGIGRAAAATRAVELLELVGISQPERRAKSFPHELSGGERSRSGRGYSAG